MDSDSPRVASLHRYPVKSTLGEDVPALDIDVRGCVGDRVWSVRTAAGKIGSGKTTRRFAAVPGLLDLRAAHHDGFTIITFPDGTTRTSRDPDAETMLSRHLGQPVTLRAEADESHFDDGPVSLLGLASLRAVEQEAGARIDPRRFRANVVLATDTPFAEDHWVGLRLEIGTAVLRVEMTSPRCVMVDAATADLPPQPGNLLAVGRANRACIGIVASVVTPGTVTIGDRVVVG